MPILDIQKRWTELGRIRLGEKRTSSSGKVYPSRLETFRLTSPRRELLDRAAESLGGEVQPWQSPRGAEWQLTTEASELDVIVPQQDLEGRQSYELWGQRESGRPVERLRACDSVTEEVSGKPCLCNPENRECKPTTHLVVVVPAIPGLGVWRVTTRGVNAAAELPLTAGYLAGLMAQGAAVRGVLGVETRSSVVDGDKHVYVVPTLTIPYTYDELAEGLPEGVAMPALGSGTGSSPTTMRPELPAARPALPIEPEPVPTPDDEEGEAAGERSPPPLPSSPPEDADTLGLLSLHLEEVPPASATMQVHEAYARQLFNLMERMGLWRPSTSGIDSLHMALAKRGAEHVGDLRKAELIAFRDDAVTAARDRVGALVG